MPGCLCDYRISGLKPQVGLQDLMIIWCFTCS